MNSKCPRIYFLQELANNNMFFFFLFLSYGLLGASGCGKTTVLSSIVGRRKLDGGKISVFGGVPGDRRTGVPGNRVGYMPQVRS